MNEYLTKIHVKVKTIGLETEGLGLGSGWDRNSLALM